MMINLNLVAGIGDEELQDWLDISAEHLKACHYQVESARKALGESEKRHAALEAEQKKRNGPTEHERRWAKYGSK